MSPNQAPPPRCEGAPHRFALPVGTRLTRVHSEQWAVAEFNPTLARNPQQGGRFDATDADPHQFLYAAQDDAVAVAETLLRNLPFNDHGNRVLPRARLRGMRIGWLETAHELPLVDVRSGRALAAVGQDAWLTSSPASDYPMTRQWAVAIRSWAPWACGMTWRSRQEPDGFAYVFFADRCPVDCFEPANEAVGEPVNIETPLPPEDRALDEGTAALYCRQILGQYRVAVL